MIDRESLTTAVSIEFELSLKNVLFVRRKRISGICQEVHRQKATFLLEMILVRNVALLSLGADDVHDS
jgi:hypothetical protein